MQSVSMNIAAMFIGVCVDMCVWPGPNGRTTAHQLLFDYGWRGSGIISVIRHRDIHTYIPCAQKTHTLCQSWVEK